MYNVYMFWTTEDENELQDETQDNPYLVILKRMSLRQSICHDQTSRIICF